MLLYRYISREFVKPLIFSTASFGGLVMISEFFRELNYFLEKKVHFLDVFAYLACSLPWWCIQVLPVSVLLAVLFSLGDLARHNEITAIKASGINLWKIIVLFMLGGIVIGVADFGIREFVIPRTVREAEHIRDTRIHREEASNRFEYYNHVVTLPNNGRMTIGYLNLKSQTMTAIVIDFFDDNDILKRQVVAASADWHTNDWTFHKGVERIFKAEQCEDHPFTTLSNVIRTPPEAFVIKHVRPELMNTPDFIRYIKNFEMIGAPAQNEKIQLNQRFASVVSHMIVMCIGIPFALGLGSRHGKLISFTFALIFAFVYWGLQAVGQSLGENNIISPPMAAWLGNIVFSGIGLWMISRVEK
jgi:lipopolysaccharide export system permease protein